MRKPLLLVVFSFIAVGSLGGCTRKSANTNQILTLSLGSGSGQGAQSIPGNLEFAVVNVQLPTGPVVKQWEFGDNPPAAGSQLTMEVDLKNVPKGATFLVQFLGVFKSDGQPSIFAYDDEMASNNAAENSVTLNAVQIGTFTREGNVAGRYISQTSPSETGPSGTLIMQYRPPGWPTVPKLSIERTSMVDGWFNIMALDGAPMDYVLLESGEVIFDQIRLTGTGSGGQLTIAGSGMSPSSSITAPLARFTVPASYRERGQGKVDPRGPEETWVGYFVKPGVTGVASKKVCVPSTAAESTSYFADPALTTRIDMDLAGSGAGIVRYEGGGSPITTSQLYDGTSTSCYSAVTAPNRIVVYHTLLGSDGDRAAGIEPPFKAVKPFARWDNFLKSTYTSSPSEITLTWAYLPGATSFDGVVIYGKSSNSGSSNGDTCDQLTGYSEIASVGPGVTSYNVPVTANTQNSWQFAVCAYKGNRQWVGKPIRGGQLGNWEQTYHTGWAKASQTATGATSENLISYTVEPVNRVSDVDASNAFTTHVVLANSVTSLTTGDEVLLTVTGRGTSTDCGTYNGIANDVGSFGFARVISASGMSLKIQKDTWVESLDPVAASTFTTAAAPASTFCYVSVQRVPHYRTVNLGGTSTFNGGGAFDMAGTGGLITAFRVNGTLTVGTTTFDTDGMGYQGAPSLSYAKGGGVRGPIGSTATGSGGLGGTDGSGGAGYGNGATTDVSGGQAYYGPNNSSARFVFGGGGGLGGSSNYGGNGGGVIFIAARNMHLTGNATLKANGASGLSSYGGGGGGGSIVLNVGKLTRAASQTLNLNANGGIGGGASNGGKGGGGSVSMYVCETTLAVNTDIFSSVAAGSSGTGSGAQAGYANISLGTANSNGYCSLN